MNAGTIADRLRSLVPERQKAESARNCRMPVKTFTSYLEGVEPSASKLVQLADGLNVNLLWLATGEGPMRPADDATPATNGTSLSTMVQMQGLPPSIAADFALIPRLDIRASAGNGALSYDEEVIDFLAFQASWLRARNVNPDSARVMTAKGDSMEPTIRDGDVLLVDTSIDRVRDNALYIIVFEGLVFVKRIHMKLNGAILLISDNERYPPEEVTPEAAPRLHVAGRVVWFGRSI